MTIEEVKEEFPTFDTFAKMFCTNCKSNDWYCPSYCDTLLKAQGRFERVLKKYAEYDGDLIKVNSYIKRAK